MWVYIWHIVHIYRERGAIAGNRMNRKPRRLQTTSRMSSQPEDGWHGGSGSGDGQAPPAGNAAGDAAFPNQHGAHPGRQGCSTGEGAGPRTPGAMGPLQGPFRAPRSPAGYEAARWPAGVYGGARFGGWEDGRWPWAPPWLPTRASGQFGKSLARCASRANRRLFGAPSPPG